MWTTYLVIMLGGAVGTGLRLWFSSLLAVRYGETFPVGTLVVNVTGCLVIGMVATVTGPEGRFLVSPLWRQAVMIGVLGGYTTFSSFSLQTIALVGDGEWARAGWNVGLSMVLCLVAVRLGVVAGVLLNR